MPYVDENSRFLYALGAKASLLRCVVLRDVSPVVDLTDALVGVGDMMGVGGVTIGGWTIGKVGVVVIFSSLM